MASLPTQCVVLGLLLPTACKSSGAEPATAAAPAPASQPAPAPPASPEVVCEKIASLGDKEAEKKQGDDKKVMVKALEIFRVDCVKRGYLEKEKDPAGYAETASCVEAATQFDDALKC